MVDESRKARLVTGPVVVSERDRSSDIVLVAIVGLVVGLLVLTSHHSWVLAVIGASSSGVICHYFFNSVVGGIRVAVDDTALTVATKPWLRTGVVTRILLTDIDSIRVVDAMPVSIDVRAGDRRVSLSPDSSAVLNSLIRRLDELGRGKVVSARTRKIYFGS